MKPAGIKRVSPGVLSPACHSSANQKKERGDTIANQKIALLYLGKIMS